MKTISAGEHSNVFAILITLARSKWNAVSAEGEPVPSTTDPFASTRTKLSGDNVPLCNPVPVIARTKGTRRTTALKLPLVPRAQPRAWHSLAISAKKFPRQEVRGPMLAAWFVPFTDFTREDRRSMPNQVSIES
jgi:hypothetical protein